MADPKPIKKTNTDTFKVYGQEIDVEYDYTEDPEKGKVLELDKINGKITLRPSQEVLSNQLFLPEFIKTHYAKDPKGADKWLHGILHEIIIDKCRTDRDIITAKPCINFQAYLMELASQIQRDPTKIPYISKDRMGSTIEIKRQMDAKKALNAQKAQDGISSGKDYGALTVTLTIKLEDILDPDAKSDTDAADYSTDDTDKSHDSDNTLTREMKRKQRLLKKKIKEEFAPSDCKEESKFKPITEENIRSQVGGDPVEIVYDIFKQYRGKTCVAGNILTDSLPYNKYIKMMLNQGNYQYKQITRIYELYKQMI